MSVIGSLWRRIQRHGIDTWFVCFQRINQIEKELTNKLDILVQENTKFQQDEISKVLEVTEEVELYLKEMLFIVEHGSDILLYMSIYSCTFD
jgi:hypothetical protein